MDVIGILKQVNETQKISDTFQKREFVVTIEPNSQYPQHVSFQATQDKCGLFDFGKFKVGDEVKVHFNLRGREWNGPEGVRYFNTLEAWRIEMVNKAAESPQQNNSQTKTEGEDF